MPPTELNVQRVRHPLKMRLLEVKRVARPTPHLARITLAGDDLRDFVSASFDDHVKVFFPPPGAARPVLPELGPDGLVFAEGEPRAPMRDYTPRRHDARAGELDLEFVLHGEGPAASWAAQAQPGQQLGVAGPRGSFVVPLEYDWHLLVGDESALPAIARRLEELPPGKPAIAVIEVTDPAARLALSTRAQASVQWLLRESAGSRLPEAVRALRLPPGEGYAWAAAESTVARAVRQVLADTHGLDKSRIRAASYWKRGQAAVHETHD